MFNIWKKKPADKGMVQDKRAHPRLDVYHLAKYKLVTDSEEKEFALAHIKNISGGGVCLETQEELPASAVVQLLINMPGLDQPVSSMAKICWSKKIGKKNIKYENGIQFLEIADMFRQEIIRRIGRVDEKLGGGKEGKKGSG